MKPKMPTKAILPLLITFVALVGILYFFGGSFSFAPLTLASDQKAYVTSLMTQPIAVYQGEKIHVPFRVYSPTGGSFYAEAGLQKATRQPLAITVQGSKCGDKISQYAGDFITLAPGETKQIDAILYDYGITGVYDIVIGVYSGCGGITYDDTVESSGAVIKPTLPTTTTTVTTSGSTGVTTVVDTGVFGGELSGFSVKPVSGTTFNVGEKINIKGKFTATGDGKYYIEGGLNPYSGPVASIVDLSASISQCDAKETHAGVWANLKKGDIANLDLTVVTQEAGTYNAVLTATDGCYTPSHTPNHAGQTQVQVIKIPSDTPPPPTTNKSIAECQTGQTSERNCASTNAGLTGTQKLVCQGGAWNVQSGQCTQKGQLCSAYQSYRDGSCKFSIGKFFTTSGLSTFGSENPITSVFVVVLLMVGVFYLTPIIQKKMKRRK